MTGRARRPRPFAFPGFERLPLTNMPLIKLQPSARVGLVAWLGVLGLLSAVGCKKSTPSNEQASGAPAIPSLTRAAPELMDRVLAKVGDQVITLGDYANVLDRMDRFERMRYQTPERRKALLEELINTELLAREAERRGLDKQPETQAYVNQLLADEVRRRLRGTLPEPEELPADEVREYYAAHRDELATPERRRIALLSVASKTHGEKLLAELRDDASLSRWNQLSLAHHVVPAHTGALPTAVLGDEGFVTAEGDTAESERLSAAVRKAAFEIAEAGVVPKLVEDDGLFHLVRVTTIVAAHVPTLEEADTIIRSRLIDQRLSQKEAELHKLLENEAPVEVNEAVISRLKRATP